MINLFDSYDLMRMIEEGDLMNRKKVLWSFEISGEELDEAILTKQISKPLEKFGGKYYLKSEIELYISNSRDDQSEIS